MAAKDFVQLRHDIEIIICSAYAGFIFGGPNYGE